MKPFRVGNLQNDECVSEMNELARYPHPPSTKGREYNDSDWAVCDKQFSDHEISVATRDRLTKSMYNELDEKYKDDLSVPHE